MQTPKIQESLAAAQYRGPTKIGVGGDGSPSFSSILAEATADQQSSSQKSPSVQSTASSSTASNSPSSAVIAGMIHLGYNGQFPPQYPPGYPKAMQDKMNQLLQNPSISAQTKSQAWSFAVASPYMQSTMANADVTSTGNTGANYNNPNFSANKFWSNLVQETSRAGPAFADLTNAFKSVS